jgi:hypothetical protein
MPPPGPTLTASETETLWRVVSGERRSLNLPTADVVRLTFHRLIMVRDSVVLPTALGLRYFEDDR